MNNDDVRLTVAWGKEDDWRERICGRLDVRLQMEYVRVRLGW